MLGRRGAAAACWRTGDADGGRAGRVRSVVPGRSGTSAAVAACRTRRRRGRCVVRAQAAYVIYTSGSTGGRRAWRSRTAVWPIWSAASGQRFGAGPGVRVLQFASFGFDFSVLELWVRAVHGRHAGGRALDGGPLPASARPTLAGACRVTTRRLPPAVLGAAGRRRARRDRGAVAGRCGGEALPRRRLAGWSAGRRLVNITARPRRRSVAADVEAAGAGAAVPSIGGRSPTPGCSCWTTRSLPVPVGVVGELYVAGARAGPRLRGPAGPDGGAVRGLSVRCRASGCTAPVTWRGGRPTGSWCSRPRRRAGEDPRVPDRAG